MRTLAMLDGRDILGTGLGLGAFKLILLPSAGSLVVPDRALPDVNMLLGLPPFRAPAAAAAGLGGAGWAMTVTAFGRQNMPRPTPPHSKYRSPLTLPSFFPELSSSCSPTHSPVWKLVRPRNRMIAVRPSVSRTVWPSARPSSSDMVSRSTSWLLSPCADDECMSVNRRSMLVHAPVGQLDATGIAGQGLLWVCRLNPPCPCLLEADEASSSAFQTFKTCASRYTNTVLQRALTRRYTHAWTSVGFKRRSLCAISRRLFTRRFAGLPIVSLETVSSALLMAGAVPSIPACSFCLWSRCISRPSAG